MVVVDAVVVDVLGVDVVAGVELVDVGAAVDVVGWLVVGAGSMSLAVPFGPFVEADPPASDDGCVTASDPGSSSTVPAIVVAQPVASSVRTAVTTGCSCRSGAA
ncbi:MAG: hypothetical protein RLN74_13445, partial [Ilumatobacter fluminis]